MNRMTLTIAGVFSASSLMLVDSAVKGTVLLVLAAVAAWILKRDSAATRHLVWLTAIVALLVMPALTMTLPQWRVLPAWLSSSQPAVAVVSPPTIAKSSGEVNRSSEIVAPVEVEWPSAPDFQPATALSNSPPDFVTVTDSSVREVWSWDWISVLPLVWTIGFVVLMLRLSAARWMLWNSEQHAKVIWPPARGIGVQSVNEPENAPGRLAASATIQDPIVMAMQALSWQLGIGRPITLLIHPAKTIPVVWGILHRRLMLPATARQWSEEQLQSVLLHELAHIKRRDPFVQLLTQVACALHWFNPLVWFAAWRLDVERERSCDDLVLASGVRPSAYAGHLLDVVTGLSPARWTQACGLAMARKSSLEGRLTAVLGKDLNRRRVSMSLAGLALVIAVGIAVPIAMLRAAQYAETNSDDKSMNDEPKDDKSKALFASWKTSARTDGKIPGGRIGEMATVLKTYMDSNAGSQAASSCEEVFKKCDVTRDWIPSEAASLLDEIQVAVPGLAEWAMETNMERQIHFGKPLPADLKDAPWGSPEAQGEQSDASSVALRGLRMAWLLEPQDKNKPLGSVMKPRVLFHNTGKISVCFATHDWIQSGMHTAKDATGKNINVWATDRLGRRTRMIFHLAPDEYAEVEGHSIGVGSHESITDKRTQIVWAWIEAKQGDVVTFQPGKLHVSFQTWQNNEGRKDSQTVWNETIAARVTQEGPWPASVADRELLLKRVTRDLGIPLPTEDSRVEKLLNDNSSDCLVQLTARLQAAGASMHFSGELRGGETTIKVTAARPKEDAVMQPNHKYSREVYANWLRHARANGDIPGALVGEMATAVKTFIGYNPTWETVPKLNAILPRLDATHDWKPVDAISLLDELVGIQDTLLKPAPWKGTRHTIRQGDALPKKFADASWGEEQPSGLRAAWVLESSAAEQRIGAAIKARLLVQNRGQVPVLVQVPTWHQGWVKATDANGAEVEASGLMWTTMAQLFPCRLGPGEYIEISTPGVGIGPRAGMGPWPGPRVGSNVLAKPGDELTLTYSLVPLDGSEVGVSQDDPHVSGPGWWLAHIKARLNRELPLPADAAERTRILDRSVRDLFATAPTAEEIATFVADQTSDAIEALAKRLASRTDVMSFSGKLPTAPAKLRVLAENGNADKQPRVVLGPGEYPLSKGTAHYGAVTLKIVGRSVSDRLTNDAQLLFEAVEFTGIVPPAPHKLNVPDGWGTWAIVCRPGQGFFYLLQKGRARKIDYTKPRNVTDTPADDFPAEFRDEVKRILDILEISAESQAEVFGKPAPPAATSDSQAGAIDPIKDPFTAWGKEVGGLQAGLGFKVGEQRAYSHGETVRLIVRFRNVGKEEVKFQYLRQYFIENPPTVKYDKDKPVDLGRVDAFGEHGHVEVRLAPGKEIELYELALDLASGSNAGIGEPKFSTIYGTGKFQIQYDKVLGNSSSGSIKLDPALSKLATGKLELEIKPIAPMQQEAPKPKQAAMLKPATEQMLKWGKPVNGLRAALAMHPVPDEPDAEDKNDIFLVVQNVSQSKIWLHSSNTAPNPRQLIWREKGVLETITETAKPIPADYHLQPGEAAFFRMLLPPGKRNPSGRSGGSIIAESIHGDPDFDLTGMMEITTPPAGAWTGKLLSGEIKGGTAIPVVSPE